MQFEEQNNRIGELKKALRERFAKQGLLDEAIERKMIGIDTSFLLHAQINGMFEHLKTAEERLKLYISTLEHELKD